MPVPRVILVQAFLFLGAPEHFRQMLHGLPVSQMQQVSGSRMLIQLTAYFI